MDPETSLAPQSLAAVEELVQELYRPGQPQRIAKVQETLHTLQKSAEGWQLANSLLRSSDEKTQFFGALTFTVKLNTDSASLSKDDADEVLRQLISWLILSLRRSSSPLVIRKLCSTLVVYFLNFLAAWTRCIRYLVLCLLAGEAVDIVNVENAPETSLLVQSLAPEDFSAALCFSALLAEEVGKTDGNNIKHYKFHDQLKQSIFDVVALITPGLADSQVEPRLSSKLRQDSMKCFQSWVLYSHRAFVDAGIVLEPLKSLTKPAITCLVQDDMYEISIELFSEVLANYPKFLTDDNFDLLFMLFNSDWSKERYRQLILGDFSFEYLQYGNFMIAYGDARADKLAKANDPQSLQFLEALEGLLSAKGYAVAEDQIFSSALEFWTIFVEVIIDTLYADEDVTLSILNAPTTTAPAIPTDKEAPEKLSHEDKKNNFDAAAAIIMRAIERCWRKIQFPPADVFDDWDSTEKAAFFDARADVIDLLEASYTLTGMSLFSMFADMALRSLQTGAWNELEASLFCLGGLSDCISDHGASNASLERVIGSTLFATLADSATEVPLRTKQATLTLIGKYDEFFKTHTQYLPEVLSFLFRALNIQSLATTASKSIQLLCSSCRGTLASELDILLQQYNELILSRSFDGNVKERIAGAIAAVIQAISPETLRQLPLMSLLQSTNLDFELVLQLHASGNIEEAEACAVDLVRCIVNIAKGLQAPSDIPLELSKSNTAELNQFWTGEEGSAIQNHVLTIIDSLISLFPRSGEIVESACALLRAGFAERTPGPFVYPEKTIVAFFEKMGPHSPRPVVIINTACSFVSAHNTNTTASTIEALHRLSTWLFAFLEIVQDPSNDPEIAQAGIDFLYRLLPTHAAILMGQSPAAFEFLFMFALKALRGGDPMPKSAAADFWSAFLCLSDLPNDLQRSVQMALEQLGPLIARALIYNVSGSASRSELDIVCDPLKKLVVRHSAAKAWLHGAIYSEDFTSDKVGADERNEFLQKIMYLRGAKHTNRIVKNLWVECRGSKFAYTS